MSWIAPHLSYAFYGYTALGHTEELWILDVEGTRLLIAADRSPGSPRKDLAMENQATPTHMHVNYPSTP
jgi:hypothetical protein